VLLAIQKRDLPAIQGSIFSLSVIFLLVNLLTDVLYAKADLASLTISAALTVPQAAQSRGSLQRASRACSINRRSTARRGTSTRRTTAGACCSIATATGFPYRRATRSSWFRRRRPSYSRDYRARTSIYANAPSPTACCRRLILYGRGDPTWSQRCYTSIHSPGRLRLDVDRGGCDRDSLRAHGIRRVAGRIVGDGSYFEPILTHSGLELVSISTGGTRRPSPGRVSRQQRRFPDHARAIRRCPSVITWNPDLGFFTFENRARTVTADSSSTIGDNFFRKPGRSTSGRGHGFVDQVALDRELRPSDPNLYAPARSRSRYGRRESRSAAAPRARRTRWSIGRFAAAATRWWSTTAGPAGHRFPDPEHEPELVRGNLAENPGREVGDTGAGEKASTSRSGFLSIR